MRMEPKLKDPAFVAKMAKFVKASVKGWDWARKNDKEAAKIVLADDTTGAQTLHHQEQMMGEIAKLLGTEQRLARRQGRTTARSTNCCPAAPIRSSPRSPKAPGPTPSMTR